MRDTFFIKKDSAEKIHEAAINVLENTGVSLNHEEAEELFLEAGARKDQEGRVLIPRKMVNTALEKAQNEIQMYDRDGKESILLKDGNNYFGPGSDALYNRDLETWEIRRTKLSDIANNVKIADYLDFDFIMSMGLPEKVPEKKLYASIFARMIFNTDKPIVFTSTSPEDVKQIHELASIAAGSKEKLSERPFLLAYMEPISPLQMDRSGIERMLYCVENDIPVLYAAGANSGSGAPISPLGGVIQGTAESLAGLTLALLKNENARFVFGANTSAMDMKKMIVAYGPPEWPKTVAMYADMGNYYDLPSWGTAGCSDTYDLDPQAAWEAQESILMAVNSRTTMAHDVGFLGHGELYDPRMLVLTDEMIKRAKHLLKGVEPGTDDVNEVLEAIDDVSRGREIYPSHPHTFRHFRQELWLSPDYVFKGTFSESKNAREFNELLKDRVKEILTEHSVNSLSPQKKEVINEYLGKI